MANWDPFIHQALWRQMWTGKDSLFSPTDSTIGIEYERIEEKFRILVQNVFFYYLFYKGSFHGSWENTEIMIDGLPL